MWPINWFKEFYTSISDISFYSQKNIPLSLWHSIRFLITSIILIGIIASTHLTITLVPKIESAITTVPQELIAHYPTNTTVTWDGTTLSINPYQRFDFAWPNGLLQFDIWENLPRLSLVVDTQSTVESLQTSTPNALVLIDSTTLSMKENGNQWQTASLQELIGDTAFSVSDEQAKNALMTIPESLKKLLPYFYPALWVVYLLYFVLGRLLIVLIESLLLLFFWRLFNRQFSNNYTIAVGFHVGVIAVLADVSARIFHPDFAGTAFNFTFWGLLILITWFAQMPTQVKGK